MKESTEGALWRAFLILAGLGFIEASVRLGWIDPFFLASPLQAIGVLWSQLVSGNALYLILVTLYEIAAALVISTVVGLLVGFVLWRYQLIGASYELFLAALFSSPVILAYPIFLVFFGRTSAAVIVLSSFFGLVPIIMNTKSAFQHVNPILLQVGASMNLSRQRMFRHILLPCGCANDLQRLSAGPDLHSQVGAWFGVRGSGRRRGHVDLRRGVSLRSGRGLRRIGRYDTAFDLVSFHD